MSKGNNPTIFGKMIDAGGKLKVSSALNPILWLDAIMGTPCILVAALKDPAPLWTLIVIFVLLGATILGFMFLLVIDRDKLQSEEYQLRKQELNLVQEKGESQPQLIEYSSFTEIKEENVTKTIKEKEDNNG